MTWIVRRVHVLLGTVALVAGLVGCSSTPTWEPGAPDALTAEHYALALSAIDARVKPDAQAALYLLRADVTRMRTNAPEMQVALARLYAVTNAVDKEDWAAARTYMDMIRASYGRSGAK